MADLVRGYPWQSTRLGPIDTWSKELLALVNVVLSSPLPMLVCWGSDLILLYNDAARPMASTKHPHALGGRADQVWEQAWRIIGPEVERVLRTGESVSHEGALVPFIEDGELRDSQWNYSFSPAYEEGLIAGTLLVCANVTEDLKSRQALRVAADRLDRALGATTDAIFSLDRDWRFTFINPRAYEVIGKGSEVLGTNIWESFPGTVYEGSPYLENYHHAMLGGVTDPFEAFYPEPLNVWLSIAAHPTEEGITVSFRDVTKDKEREKLLIRTEKLAAVGRMAASISHEINNPLEAVTNLLYIARTERDLTKVRAYLDNAERELRRVGHIVNQTLRFHRQPSNPTTLSCIDLISSVLNMYESRLQNASIGVSKRKRATKPVEVYEGDIRQVLNNLIGNALDAMPNGGRLIVRSRDATDWKTGRAGLVITIADNGSGIAPGIRQRVFEAFFTTKGIGGSGLGLWVSSEIIERHQGRIRFRSSLGERHGTVFSMFLPFEGRPLPT